MILKPRQFRKPNLGHRLMSEAGLWLFNEGSDTKVFDLSGNGNNGTINGNVAWIAGKFGSALDFSGGYVDCGKSSVWENLTGLTLSIWCNPDVWAGSTRVIFGNHDFAQDDEGFSIVHYSDMLRFIIHDTTGVKRAEFTYTTVGEWIHIACVYRGAGFKSQIFLNGHLQDESDSNLDGLTESAHNLRIGSDQAGGRTFDGKVDNANIYNRAQPASEITKLYSEPFCMVEKDNIDILATGAAPPPGGGQVIIIQTMAPIILVMLFMVMNYGKTNKI